jgi:polyisoprenoid-binding protein YceI
MFLRMTRCAIAMLTVFAAMRCAFADGNYSLAASPASHVELVVTKTGFLRGKQHVFVFDRFGGTLRYDSRKPDASHVEFEIASKSILCKDTWGSANDLRKIQDVATKDMLDVEHHPTITFRSIAVHPTKPGMFEVRGELTIRRITKPVVVAVSVSPNQEGRLSVDGSAQVRLTDYGLKPPSAAFGTIGTKDEMALSFHLDAKPQ